MAINESNCWIEKYKDLFAQELALGVQAYQCDGLNYKAVMNPPKLTRDYLKALVKEKGETWGFSPHDDCVVIGLWPSKSNPKQSDPVGFVAFTINFDAREECLFDPIEDSEEQVSLHLSLVWVDPQYRKKGLGRCLVSFLIHTLEWVDCGIAESNRLNYLPIYYSADYYTKGGARLSNYIESWLDLFHGEGWDDMEEDSEESEGKTEVFIDVGW